MDLDTYDEWAREELMFIGTLMEKEGVTAVLQSCLQMGKERLDEEAQLQAEQVQEFFHTPRQQRERLLERFDDDQERHAFLVAVLHEARCASSLLELLCKYGVSAGANPSKSMMVGQAAQVAREVSEQLPSLYPFAEDLPFGMSLGWFGLK